VHSDEHYLLRFERHLRHPVPRVWQALTEPSELAQWFPAEVEIDLSVGGKITFAYRGFDVDPALLPSDGVVTELDPPRLLAFTWGEDLLRFELTARTDGCTLQFSHRFENRASAPRSAAGWAVCLDSLTAMLDARQAENRWTEYFQHYTESLGADGTFVRHGDTAVLRFERLPTQPAEQVWDALTKPERVREWLADARFEARPGGSVDLRFGTPAGYAVTGQVTRAEPPRVLEYTWASPGEPEGSVKWQLIPAGDRCILLFTHTVHGHWHEAGTVAAWHVHLTLLADALSGRPTWPFPEARWHELHQHYAGTIG
jgi:uncharacterized protein YndB with AHSA1/START domain